MELVSARADNAAKEPLLFLLQRIVPHRKAYVTRQEMRLAIVSWIERTYHRRRRQRTLSKLTPIEIEPSTTRPLSGGENYTPQGNWTRGSPVRQLERNIGVVNSDSR